MPSVCDCALLKRLWMKLSSIVTFWSTSEPFSQSWMLTRVAGKLVSPMAVPLVFPQSISVSWTTRPVPLYAPSLLATTYELRQLTLERLMTTPGALTVTQPWMSLPSTTVFAVVMTRSPLTVLSEVPAGTPVQVASGYLGRAQEPPALGGFTGGVLDCVGVGTGSAGLDGDALGDAVTEGTGWGRGCLGGRWCRVEASAIPDPATMTVTRTASVAISGFRINTALFLGRPLVTQM